MKKGKGKIAEINVVPLVDIMLVLLIIFMITAPLMFNGINLKLPRTSKSNQIKLEKKQAIVSITKAGDLFLGKEQILKSELVKETLAFLKVNKGEVVFVRADYAIKYGEVANIMSILKGGGIQNISLVTEVDN